MTVLDLFSCVGCHALGMQRAGHSITALCEINPWRRQCLSQNFPSVRIYEDIRHLPTIRADICFGGPPCQQTSVAAAIHGSRTGESLWPHMLRAGLNSGAEWIIVEQPPGNATWEAEVEGDLSGSGFHVGRFSFTAADIGAPYIRRRVYLVACASLPRLEVAWSKIPFAIDRAKGAAASRGDWSADSIQPFGVDSWRSEGVHERRERIEALGDSNPPAMAEVIGLMVS